MTPLPADLTSACPIIVHSHRRWDFVWQRPPQLLLRFAHSCDVLFVEEPLFLDDAYQPTLELLEAEPRITRAIPRLPASYRESDTGVHVAVRALLLEALANHERIAGRFDAPIQWFSTPMPAPAMIGAFGESAVVYDCIDEFATSAGTSTRAMGN